MGWNNGRNKWFCLLKNKLKFDEVRGAIKRIFSPLCSQEIEQVIKTEAFVSHSKYHGKSFSKNTNSTHQEGQWNESRFSGDSKKMNPKNKFGKNSRCGVCGSVYHWVRDCPDKDNFERKKDSKATEAFETTSVSPEVLREKAQTESLVTIVLATSTDLLSECQNRAILDTACTSNVCIVAWLDIFLNSFTESDKASYQLGK